jgi:hypothetical protein
VSAFSAARLQEARKVRALPQLRDRQVDPADAGLPGPLAIAVSVVGALGAARSGRRAGALIDFGRNEALGAVGQQLTDELGVVGLLDQLHQRHLVIGHRRLRSVRVEQPEPLPKTGDGRPGPPAARSATPEGSARGLLHQPSGH